jgi:hypothetical protein
MLFSFPPSYATPYVLEESIVQLGGKILEFFRLNITGDLLQVALHYFEIAQDIYYIKLISTKDISR